MMKHFQDNLFQERSKKIAKRLYIFRLNMIWMITLHLVVQIKCQGFAQYLNNQMFYQQNQGHMHMGNFNYPMLNNPIGKSF